ncbi:hypothetical protein GC56T2_0917 [Geobacillus sp. C56-T2]|nr:hypothetical protein GC56T2_0917 [Geobacillus sp. C56-T2]
MIIRPIEVSDAATGNLSTNIICTNCCSTHFQLAQNALALWASSLFVALHPSDSGIRFDDNFGVFLFVRFFRRNERADDGADKAKRD